jgi:hypothetical protein
LFVLSVIEEIGIYLQTFLNSVKMISIHLPER